MVFSGDLTDSLLYDSEVDDWQMQESAAQPTGPADFLFCGVGQLSVVSRQLGRLIGSSIPTGN
jgi:hypothetical protein